MATLNGSVVGASFYQAPNGAYKLNIVIEVTATAAQVAVVAGGPPTDHTSPREPSNLNGRAVVVTTTGGNQVAAAGIVIT